MTALRVMTVDDEVPALTSMRTLLCEDQDVHLVAECRSANDAETVLLQQEVDILFLDIQMPDRSGMELAMSLATSERCPAIIFVTAHDQFAVQAFEAHALDYLLKPYSDDRFVSALARVKQFVRSGRTESTRTRIRQMHEELVAHTATKYPSRIVARAMGRTEYVPVDDVIWIESANYYAWLHGPNRRELVRLSLEHLESVLDPAEFIRVHRSAIVRLSSIRTLLIDGKGNCSLLISSGERLPLSRGRRDAVERALANLSGHA